MHTKQGSLSASYGQSAFTQLFTKQPNLQTNKYIIMNHELNFDVGKIETLWEKEKMPAVSPICTMFSKCLFLRVVKSSDHVVKPLAAFPHNHCRNNRQR